jgi:hypothetical protein
MLLRWVPTRLPKLTRVVAPAAAPEVEHLEGVVGPFGVPEEDGVLLPTVWAADVRAGVKRSRVVHPSYGAVVP